MQLDYMSLWNFPSLVHFQRFVHLYVLGIFNFCSIVCSRHFQLLFNCMFATFSTFDIFNCMFSAFSTSVHLYVRDKLTVIASRLLILSFFGLLKFLGLGRLFALLRFTFCVFAILFNLFRFSVFVRLAVFIRFSCLHATFVSLPSPFP